MNLFKKISNTNDKDLIQDIDMGNKIIDEDSNYSPPHRESMDNTCFSLGDFNDSENLHNQIRNCFARRNVTLPEKYLEEIVSLANELKSNNSFNEQPSPYIYTL